MVAPHGANSASQPLPSARNLGRRATEIPSKLLISLVSAEGLEPSTP